MQEFESLEELEKQLQEVENWLRNNKKSTEQSIYVSNKPLKDALTQQLTLQSEVDDHYVAVSHLLKEFEILCDQTYSKVIDKLLHDRHRNYSIGEAKAAVNTDNNYITAKRYYNRCYKVYSQIKHLSELIITRKYVLNNLTNSIINSVEDYIL